jgi:Amt family ammonium transporter
VCIVTLSLLGLAVYKIAELFVGNRVSIETEIEGLDVPEMGLLGYNGVVMDRQGETPLPRG